MAKKKCGGGRGNKGSGGGGGGGGRGASGSASSSSSSSRQQPLPFKVLLLFRHGESLAQTTGDKKGRMTDPSMRDAALSAKGKRDAQKLGQDELLARAPLQLVLCSPLTRSLQSCCLAFKARTDLPLVCHPSLKEFGRRALTGAENTGRPVQELCSDPELTALPRFHDIDLSRVDPRWTPPGDGADAGAVGEKEAANAVWWEAPAMEADRTVRLARLRDWLLRRPERVLCITAHGQVFQELLGTQQRMVNCQLMLAGMDAAGSMRLLEFAKGTAPALALMQRLASMPPLLDRTVDEGLAAAPSTDAAAAAAAATVAGGGGGRGGGEAAKGRKREGGKSKKHASSSSSSSTGPKFALLVGLPGSGKSTFVNALLRRGSAPPPPVADLTTGGSSGGGGSDGCAHVVRVRVVGLPWGFLADVVAGATTVLQLKTALAKQTGLRARDVVLARAASHQAEAVAADDEPAVLRRSRGGGGGGDGRTRTLFAKLASLSKRDYAGANCRVVHGEGASRNWVCVSQDLVSSSALTMDLLPAHAKKSGRRVVFDNCSVDMRSRRNACDMAMVPPGKTHVVFFDTPLEECVRRVDGRPWHPTIRAGSGAGVVRSKAKRLEPPAAAEGFAAVHVVRSLADVSRLAQAWGGCEATLAAECSDGGGGGGGEGGSDVIASKPPLEQDQVMQTSSLTEGLLAVGADGGMAVKNAEHYFGPLPPGAVVMVRQRSADPVHGEENDSAAGGGGGGAPAAAPHAERVPLCW